MSRDSAIAVRTPAEAPPHDLEAVLDATDTFRRLKLRWWGTYPAEFHADQCATPLAEQQVSRLVATNFPYHAHTQLQNHYNITSLGSISSV
jgi:hypothetical protein